MATKLINNAHAKISTSVESIAGILDEENPFFECFAASNHPRSFIEAQGIFLWH